MTLGVVLLMGLIWTAFGILVAVNAHPALPDSPTVKAIYFVASILVAAGMFILWFFLYRQASWAYYSGLVAFVLSGLAVFLDDVGWIDLAFLVVCIIVLLMLIKDRRWYLKIV